MIEHTSHERPDPFAPAPLQGPHRYYEPVRQRVGQRVLSHRRRIDRPRFSPVAHRTAGSVQTRLLLFHSGAADRARATSMPDTAWPISGHPPDSSRDHPQIPVSMSSDEISTRQQWFTRVRLPGPHLTPLRAPFPHRSRPRSSAKAAWGGLKPPSAGRLRRATTSITRAASLQVTRLHRDSPSRSGHTGVIQKPVVGCDEARWSVGLVHMSTAGVVDMSVF